MLKLQEATLPKDFISRRIENSIHSDRLSSVEKCTLRVKRYHCNTEGGTELLLSDAAGSQNCSQRTLDRSGRQSHQDRPRLSRVESGLLSDMSQMNETF